MRNFTPARITVSKEFYAEIIEQRLRHSGEYMYHIPSEGDKQAVVLNYQYVPIEEPTEALFSGKTDPTLFGLADHFAVVPTRYREGTSAKAASGSQFEVRGLMYDVKSVEVNHRGYIHIRLVRSDNCEDPREGFCEEMDAFLCQ